MMPNSFAFFSLIAWPLIALWLYLSRPVGKATVWTILAGYLLLPVGTFFKIEMVPQFDKVSVPNLCALVGCILFAGRPLRFLGRMGVVEILLLLFVVGPLVTSLLNGDPIVIGNKVVTGVGAYDGFSALLFQLIILIPFLLGRVLFRTAADIAHVFYALSVAGLAYSLLLIFEIRFSPQLHNWIYGYYPSDFIQVMREGGTYRPMAFMGHGLVAAFFAMTTTVASAAFWRARVRIVRFLPPAAVTAYLSVVLILCKSGAALVYGMVLIPITRWTKPRFQMRIAIAFVLVALLYPVLRSLDIFPANTIVEISRAIDDARADSLKYRFDQEARLLEKASQRILFGWGRYGRTRVYALLAGGGEAADLSVTDGRWTITLGQFGLVGFLAEFGLLSISVFRAASALRFTESFRDSVFLSALALIMAISIIDLLPNATLSPWTWLLAGSLLGRSEMILARSRSRNLRTSPLNSAKIEGANLPAPKAAV
jgi:hypothetical protein